MATTHLLRWPDDYITEINGLMKEPLAGINYSTTLNDNSWDTISQVAQTGLADTIWEIGDCKEIVLNGTVGSISLSNYHTYVYIIDFNHPINKTIKDNNIIFGSFKVAPNGKDIALCDAYYNNSAGGTNRFAMNSKSSAYGGWRGCDLRYDILGATSTPASQHNNISSSSNIGYNAVTATIAFPKSNTLMAALPNDMRNILKLWNRYIDYSGYYSNADANCSTPTIDAGISLLTEYEIFGQYSYCSSAEPNHQKQMKYYELGNNTQKCNYNYQNQAIYWWEASPSTTISSFGCAAPSSNSQDKKTAYYSLGLAPIFKV